MQRIFQVIFFLISLQSIGQNQLTLKGKVVNAATGDPLAFSTISLLGTTEGVVSNFLGEFEFTMAPNSLMDTIYVSMLGFQPYKALVKDIHFTNSMEIPLKESVVMLKEVEVFAKELTALEIVNKVIEKIPENYPVSPYLLKGFTRSHKYECGTYVTLYEAAFSVYGQGYHKKNPERIYVDESRQSQHVPYYHSQVLRNNRNLFISMRHINDVLFRSYSLKTGYNNYEIVNYSYDKGRLVYKIQTTHSKHVTHTMYVDAHDFALLKVKMDMPTPEGLEWNPLLNKGPSSDSLDFKVTRVAKTIQFEKKEGLYHTKYMDWLVEGMLYHEQTGDEFCDWGFRFETMFDDVWTENISKPSKEKLMNPKSKKDPASTLYNPTFWKEYQLIKGFPISPQIVEDLETSLSLEEQFERAGR